MNREPVQLKDLIEAALRSCQFSETITRGQVEDAYRQVVSEIILKLTWEVRYDTTSHVLYLKYASAALKQELTYKLTDLMNAINRRLPNPVVQKIVLL